VKQAKKKTTFFLFFLYHCVHTTQDGCHCRCALSERKTHKQEALLVPKGKNHAPEVQTVFFLYICSSSKSSCGFLVYKLLFDITRGKNIFLSSEFLW
jgi:hypothetical protein